MDQVQAVVDGLGSPHQALRADDRLRALNGVLLSRTDVHTSNLYLLVRSDAVLTVNEVRAAVAPLGLTVRCFVRGPRADNPFRHLDPGQCGNTIETR